MENYRKIHIKDSDSIYEICKKIKSNSSKDSEFYLEVDENEALKNYLNLKILLARFAWKKFIIVTSNKDLKKVWEKLGIRYYIKSDEIEFDEKFSKTNVLRHNFSFSEYLVYELKKHLYKTVFLFRKKAVKTYKNKKSSPNSHVFLLFLGLVMSFSLLSFIFYFAVSKTYVYITPDLWVKTVSRNIVFSEGDDWSLFDNKNLIKVNPISLKSNLNYTFNVSSIDIKSAKNSFWKIEIFNELNTEQIFKPNTRFLSEDGLIYRSSEWIKVPWTYRDEEGKMVVWKSEVIVVADLYDNLGKIIWSRWNIKSWTLLVIPWLKFNKDKIYAKVKEDFSGWFDPKIHVLTQEENDKFVWVFSEKLKAKALDDMKQKIKNMNQNWSTNFQILPINNILTYTLWDISIVGWSQIGSNMEEVSYSWSVELATYVYDKSSTVFYLKSILNDSILLWTEKLIWINEDSLRITNILTQTVKPFYMKATTELDSTISYNFEDPTNNLTRKLKNLIVNTWMKEATSILLNEPNIANVKIEFSPFWLTHVSNNPDNIDFIIQK